MSAMSPSLYGNVSLTSDRERQEVEARLDRLEELVRTRNPFKVREEDREITREEVADVVARMRLLEYHYRNMERR